MLDSRFGLKHFRWLCRTALCLAAISPVAAEAQDRAPVPKQHFQFRDVGREAGLFPALTGIKGHAAGWGDVDGDGFPDLYVGTFHQGGTPNHLLLNKSGKFEPAGQPAVEISTRASAAVFADLDNDGDLDLYVSSMPVPPGSKAAERTGYSLAGNSMFRNEGNGKFTNISQGNAACPEAFGGRSACVLDYDGDGLLDLLVGEEPITGYSGSQTKRTRLFRNLGKLNFEETTDAAGLPQIMAGYGVAAADVNNDGLPDLFVASHVEGNRLFLNDGQGRFQEVTALREVFHWAEAKGDSMVCGVCIGDVNRDGLMDIVLGQHFQDPWLKPVANRLYLNRGLKNGVPTYEDVTEQAGLKPLPLKAPHVELQDFDNDGWPDLSCSIVKFAGGQAYPLIFKNLGVQENGVPKFSETALAVNDYPNESDLAIKRSTQFFDKMVADGKIIYMAPGPTADFNRDGKLDIFLPNWWEESPSLLLQNETAGGEWLQVRVEGRGDVNRMGIGARINVYSPGKLGDAKSLITAREIAVGFGYASAQEAIAHFGLGGLKSCDLEILLPHGKGRIERRDVKAGQLLTVKPE